MLFSNSVLEAANVVLQHFTLVTTQFAWNGLTALIIAEREGGKAERRNGEFSATRREIPENRMIIKTSIKKVRSSNQKKDQVMVYW